MSIRIGTTSTGRADMPPAISGTKTKGEHSLNSASDSPKTGIKIKTEKQHSTKPLTTRNGDSKRKASVRAQTKETALQKEAKLGKEHTHHHKTGKIRSHKDITSESQKPLKKEHHHHTHKKISAHQTDNLEKSRKEQPTRKQLLLNKVISKLKNLDENTKLALSNKIAILENLNKTALSFTHLNKIEEKDINQQFEKFNQNSTSFINIYRKAMLVYRSFSRP